MNAARVNEALVDESLVRVCDSEGVTRGTAFAVGPGVLVTCRHVVDEVDEIVAQVGGRGLDVRLVEDERLGGMDVAVLECARDALPARLALGLSPGAGTAVWTKGFQYAAVMPEAVPASGAIAGRTSVTYSARSTYELDGVLALAGVTVDAGLSGAPLLDLEWGVVVGIVNARFNLPGGPTGFAIPFEAVAAASERIAALVEHSRRSLPAHGPYLNLAAAHAACADALRDSMRRLTDRALVLADRYCARPAIDEAVQRFLESDGKVLPVVGPSGTGKTNEIAAVANRECASRPVLLVQCAEVEGAASEGIAGHLRRTLERTSGPGVSLDAGIAEIESDGAELLVLADGLNELPAEVAANEGSWLAATFGWVRRHRVRLLVTCRPDHWDLVQRWFPRDLLPPDDPPEVRMEDFTEDEALEALRRYELADRGLDPDDVRHPLLARIYSELDDTAGGLRRYDALAQYSATLCGAAALDALVPAASVRALLSAVAQRTIPRGDLVLSLADVPALDGPPLQALVRRNVLIEVPAGLRFAFDELGEWQEGQHIGPDDLESVRTGSAVFALLRLEREHGGAALVQPLTHMLADAPNGEDDEKAIVVDRVFAQITEELADAAPVEAVLQVWIDGLATHRPIADFLPARAMRRAALPVERRLELLRSLVRADRAWDWESKRWLTLPTLRINASLPSAGEVAAELLRADPAAAVPALVRWFDDRSQPLSGQATAGDVGRGLLLYHRRLAFDRICELVVARGEAELDFLTRLTEAEPALMAPICARWCASDDDERRRLGSRCARLVALDGNAPAVAREAARTALMDALDGSEPVARTEAVATFFAQAETRDLVVSRVLASYREGGSPFSAYLVVAGLDTHHDQVVGALLDVLTDPGRSDRGTALEALAGRRLTPHDLERVVAALDDAWLRTPLSWHLGRWIEETLYRLQADDPIADRFVEAARWAVRAGDQDVRICTAYGATSPSRTDDEAPWSRELFTTIVTAGSAGELPRLSVAVSDQFSQRPWLMDTVLARLVEIRDEALDLRLLMSLWRASATEELAHAIRRRGDMPEGPLAAFAALVEAGEPAEEAAEQVLRAQSP